jgi:cell division protein FtsQ
MRDEPQVPGPPIAPDDARQARKRRNRRVAVLVVAAIALYFLAPLGMRHLDYFRVRRVEIVGGRYITPASVTALMAVDTTGSVWDRLGPLEDRVREHPQVREVRVSRRLPGTLIVRIDENLPVALVSLADGLHPYDRDARPLPIDPSRTPVDLPVIARRDTLVLRLLDDLRAADPAVFARVSEVRWDEGGGLRVLMSGLIVRAPTDCSAARFLEILPVEQDLARRGHKAAELDLRYRDQVVARIE